MCAPAKVTKYVFELIFKIISACERFRGPGADYRDSVFRRGAGEVA